MGKENLSRLQGRRALSLGLHEKILKSLLQRTVLLLDQPIGED